MLLTLDPPTACEVQCFRLRLEALPIGTHPCVPDYRHRYLLRVLCNTFVARLTGLSVFHRHTEFAPLALTLALFLFSPRAIPRMSAHYLHRLIEQCWMLSQVLGSLRARCYRQGRCNIQIAGGSVGRHNHAAWAIDAHCPRRTSGVRETSDLVEDC